MTQGPMKDRLNETKIADAMEMHDMIDNMFRHLGNTGSISNSDLMKITTLSLIDDYKEDMIKCNRNWKRIIEDIESNLSGSSCMLRKM